MDFDAAKHDDFVHSYALKISRWDEAAKKWIPEEKEHVFFSDFYLGIEKMKKQELSRFLSELRQLMRHALVIQCGMPQLSEDETGKAEKLAMRISRDGLLKMSDLAAKCMDMTQVNVGTGHLLGYLTAGYYQVI